jgi:LAS superfamily LD-carboxypeptidase LdcB
MRTRSLSICVALAVSLVASASVVTAKAPAKSSQRKPIASKSLLRPSKTDKNRATKTVAAKSKQQCLPCAATAAQTRHRGRTSTKSARAVALPCHPRDYVDPKVARRYNAALRDMKRAGIKPKITSVWRSSDSQAQLRRCSLNARCRRANPGLYRALPPGNSLHEAGFAVDMAGIAAGPRGDKRLTPQGRRIVGIMRKNGFNWRYGLADPAHFEADPRKYGYRNAKEAITKIQSTCQVRLAKFKGRTKAANRIASASPHATSKSRISTVAGPAKRYRKAARLRA